MTKGDQKKTHEVNITMGDCTCKSYNVSDNKGNHIMNPTLTCDITCMKNKIVKQECYCYECSRCPNGEKSCNSEHFLSLEKLKTFSTGDQKSKKLIKNCIVGGDNSLKEINFNFGSEPNKNFLNSRLNYFKVNNGEKSYPFAGNLYYPIEFFADPNDIQIKNEEINQRPSNMSNQNDIQINKKEINQKTSNMQNKNLVTQNTHSKMDSNQNFENTTKIQNDQITENSIGNGTIATAIIGSLFFVSALFFGLGFLYKKYRKKTTETNPKDSKNVI